MDKSEEKVIMITDGGYDGQDNISSKGENVTLVPTALIGKETSGALADFEFSDDGAHLINVLQDMNLC